MANLTLAILRWFDILSIFESTEELFSIYSRFFLNTLFLFFFRILEGEFESSGTSRFLCVYECIVETTLYESSLICARNFDRGLVCSKASATLYYEGPGLKSYSLSIKDWNLLSVIGNVPFFELGDADYFVSIDFESSTLYRFGAGPLVIVVHIMG